MIVNKVILGYIVQTFDTETNECLGQDFIAGEVQYEDEVGEPPPFDCEIDLPYVRMELIQPQDLE